MAVLFGAIVGLSLGLTGGGGSIFAVPLLVYGLGVDPRQAVGVSLAAVGAMALVGAVTRFRKGLVEVSSGLIFALAGMLGAPFGSWISARISPTLLLLMFSGLMLLVAVHMWLGKSDSHQICDDNQEHTCERDERGRLALTTKCAALLMLVGVGTGVLSGLFGVGGGFVIVPALILFSRMAIHRAVSTSLLVIALIAASGVAGHALAGGGISLSLTAQFVLGGLIGMFLGSAIAKFLSGRALKRTFAVAILAVAIFVIVRTL